MKKMLAFVLLVICGYCSFCQSFEAYPTSQRYLFNPYNKDSVFVDSLEYVTLYYGEGVENFYTEGNFPCNEYQMYPASFQSPVQVYGVAIPLEMQELPYPRGEKHYYWEYYWSEESLGPRDDSIRDFYWQMFVDSMHVVWSQFNAMTLACGGERRVFEKYIYMIQKNEDPSHPIMITDSVKIRYGVNATGWNRFQRPMLYDHRDTGIGIHGGYNIVPTLEVFFDRPMMIYDTFFVGITPFLETYYWRGSFNDVNTRSYSVPLTSTSYMFDPSGCGFSGSFRSDNGEFIPHQNCAYAYDSSCWYRASSPGAIDLDVRFEFWGGPMAIVAPPPCMVANDVRMTQVGYDSAVVEWNIPVGVSHCLVEYGPQGYGPGEGTLVDSLLEGRYCIQGLEENTAYEVRVACWCIYDSSYSDKVSVGFRTNFGCPPVPAVLSSEVTDTTIALVWWMPDSADYTDVEYGPLGFAEGEGTLRPHITRSYFGYGSVTITGLEPYTAYEVRMRNYCSNSGAMSEWFSFDTVTTGPDTMTAVNAVLQEQVVLQPNPATTKVSVSSPATIRRISVVDLQGRTVFDKPVMAPIAEISTADWPRGTVVVNIYTSQGTAVKKLTIK